CLLPVLSSTSPASAALSTLSLHDALPISWRDEPVTGAAGAADSARRAGRSRAQQRVSEVAGSPGRGRDCRSVATVGGTRSGRRRSEEHTFELQSRENLVCRLLLEKKKQAQ